MPESNGPLAADLRATTIWRSRPIFLSSTFADMHDERDYLRIHAFSVLEDQLRERCHYLETIDLRQGVETTGEQEEGRRERQVLKVCLNEIKRSQPFFVGLLGDRYGWVPGADRIEAAARDAGFDGIVAFRSVTELEILYGVLASTEQRRRGWFYIRELDYTGMPTELRARFDDRFARDPHAAERARRLDHLKLRLWRELPDRVRTYHARWDPASGRVTGLDALAAMVRADLWSDLDAETRAYLRHAPSTWQEVQQRTLEDFVEGRTRLFVERPAVTAPLLQHALSHLSPEAPWGICITGESGSGKSSVFGWLYSALRARDDVLLLANAAGIDPRSGIVDTMLRRWIFELARYLDVPDPLGDPDDTPREQTQRDPQTTATAEQVEEVFTALLHRAAQRTRVVVLIDALNQFEATTRARYLTWLPRSWPANARLVATAIPGTASSALLERAGARAQPLEAIEEGEAREIASRYFRDRYHRAPNPRALDVLIAKQDCRGRSACGNPLWLELALQELNLLEADDFARAEREFAEVPGGERMEALLCGVAADLPADAAGVYSWLLGRAKTYFGAEWVTALVTLIALGRTGWRESDLRALLPAATGLAWDELPFAGVRRVLGTHLVQRGAQGQWDAFHASLREAVLTQELPHGEARQRLHGLIADHLQRLSDGDALRVSETMVHLIGLGDTSRAALHLARLKQQQWIVAVDPSELSDAVARLAEWLQDEVADSTDGRVRWTTDLLGAAGVDSDETAALSNVYVFDLTDALSVAGSDTAESARGTLLTQARHALARLLQEASLDAGQRRQIEGDVSVSLGKLGAFYLRRGGAGDGERALDAYEQCHAALQRLAAQDPNDAQTARHLSVSLENLGDFYLRRGGARDGERALDAYERSLATRQRLAAQNPNDARAARGVLVSLNKLGDFYLRRGSAGDGERALDALDGSLAIAQHLLAQNPNDAGATRDVFVSLYSLGDFYLRRGAAGDGERALDAYERSLAIVQRLSVQHPNDAQTARDVSLSLEKLGDFYLRRRSTGDSERALDAYEQSLAIAQRLCRQNPSDARAARDLAVSLEVLGDFYLRRGGAGDRERALTAYEQSVATRQRLCAQNPNDAQAASDVSILLGKLGDFYVRRGIAGDAERALDAYEQSLAIAERLCGQNQKDGTAARDAAVAVGKLGDFYLRRGIAGDGERALDAYEQCHATLQSLAAQNPNDAQAARDVSVTLIKLGDVYLRRGGVRDVERALDAYEQCHAILRRLAAQNPNDGQATRDVALSLERLGDFFLRRGGAGDGERALDAHAQSLATRQRLAVQNPKDAEAARDVALSLNRLGDIYLQRSSPVDGERAVDAYEQSHATLQRLATQDPNNAQAARDVSVSLARLGYVYVLRCGAGDEERALNAYDQALAIDKRLAEQNPNDVQAVRDAAVSLIRLGHFYVRRDGAGDGERAIDVYEQALAIDQRVAEQNPNDADATRDLAVSHYRLANAYSGLSRTVDAYTSLRECHVLLGRMRAAGMLLDPAMQQLLEELDSAFA